MWGKVVLFFKENKNITLHMACGDILNVEMKDNNFIINVEQQMLYDIISEKSNLELIKHALSFYGFDGEVIINRSITQNELISQDIKKLKSFGLKVKIF